MPEDHSTADPSRRLHRRYHCDIPVHLISLPSKHGVEGDLLNVGLGGGLLRVEGELEVEVRIDFIYDNKEYMLDAYVVVRREDLKKKTPAENYYGIEFHPYPESIERLNKFLEHLGQTIQPFQDAKPENKK